MSPAPELVHQETVGRLYLLLQALSPNGKLYFAPVDVYLDDKNVVQPDLLWIAPEGKCVPVAGQHLRGAPDLVVKVFSPGTARLDRKEKFRLYEKFGVREYRMVDPGEKLLEIWRLAEKRFTLVDVFGPDADCHSPLLGKVMVKAIFGD
jgi:Uma2 family endonuclease